MMIDGLWTAEFGSSVGIFGGGVMVFQDGRIRGGDGGYFYTGEYTVSEKTFQATVKVSPFVDNYQSLFKTVNQEFTLHLSGTIIDERLLTAQGQLVGMPHLSFGAKLIKRGQ